MSDTHLQRVCLTPQPEHVGGPAAFVSRMSAALAKRGIRVTHNLEEEHLDAVLLIGATRHLVALRQAKKQGGRVVQRLDGINWLHHLLPTGPRHWVKAQLSNTLLAYTRDRQADYIVYQSRFVQDWWLRHYGQGPSGTVIHNGVDLDHFTPKGEEKPPADRLRILLVEGRLDGGYETGLRNAAALAKILAQDQQVQLCIAGQVSDKEKSRLQNKANLEINWLGLVGQTELPALYRSAHMLFSADINPACPNSVIEAIACGAPVLAFDTGALSELVTPQAGRLADYGGDPWKLDEPDISGLAEAARQIKANQADLRMGARALAEQAFSLDHMVDKYLEAMAPRG